MVHILALQPHCQTLHNSTDIRQACIAAVPLQNAQPAIERTPATCQHISNPGAIQVACFTITVIIVCAMCAERCTSFLSCSPSSHATVLASWSALLVLSLCAGPWALSAGHDIKVHELIDYSRR